MSGDDELVSRVPEWNGNQLSSYDRPKEKEKRKNSISMVVSSQTKETLFEILEKLWIFEKKIRCYHDRSKKSNNPEDALEDDQITIRK